MKINKFKDKVLLINNNRLRKKSYIFNENIYKRINN